MAFTTDTKGKGKLVPTDDGDSSSPIMESSGDVTGIGKHCDLPSCHQLDFLPFKCGSCEGTFCLDHRTETAHVCPKEGQWAARRRQNSLNNKPASLVSGAGLRLGSSNSPGPCANPACKTVINTPKMIGVTCSGCRKQFCLPHRLPAQHDCKPVVSAKTAAEQDRKLTALSKFKLWASSSGSKLKDIKATPITQKQKSVAARLAEMNKLRKEAKGDDKVPQDKRLYLYAQAEGKSTSAKVPEGTFFYSKEWSVGRIMDITAKSLQIPNSNNQSADDDKKLRVFHVESGRLLSFGEKIGDTCVDGNTIVLLRGVKMEDMVDLAG
ncbi:hypothetical protein DRE_03338 [Drechslerella stenobrocha 248]|uniref:AN1-type domain-containing protein n=1 Tax=Drechslerella stenobrocha 248 TaxID=1043628 RepID=W7HUN2_9PEZI|nr:hypothetical protein DRE_03338 [Drechslerella stenobrocha 248]